MELNGKLLRETRQKLGLSQAKLAELTGVSQHLLSAFELEKVSLPSQVLKLVTNALGNKTNVDKLVTRSKRYQVRSYVTPERMEERVKRAAPTAGNVEYCRVLEDLGSMHATSGQRPFSALSLFSGCGGFSLGFSAGGFEVKGFVELEEDLRRIYKCNFPHSIELGGDITQIDESALEWFAKRLGNIDVIIGGPPCQGFSLSGKRQVDDPRNTLFKHYLRFVDIMQPKVAVLENVRLLTSMKSPSGTYVREDICKEFQEHGYRIRCFETNAKDYGVPQHRERVLFIAVRDDLGIDPTLPEITHGERSDLFSKTLPYRIFGDACSDLPYLESGEGSSDPLHEAVKHPAHVIDWLWDVPEGASAHDNVDPVKRPPSGYNTTYKRQVWEEPAATVQTTFGMISGCRNVHPIATRSLTIREAARLQSFPDSFRFQGTLGSIRTGIGNAVPPLLSYAIAKHVKQELLKGEVVGSYKNNRLLS